MLKTYAEVVATYIAEDQQRGDDDLKWFADQPDLDTLLEKAVMSRARPCRKKPEKRHDHQRRIPTSVLRAAHKAVSKPDCKCELQSCRTFEALHGVIDRATHKIKGIGELAVFDFACRIGNWMRPKIEPKTIYLHSGTRVGAHALKLGRGRKTIAVDELPEEFHCLSARHAEDCLCIHKDALKKIHSRDRR